MPKIYTVIPNFNGAKYLTACLKSLLDQSLSTQIIVVDNASTDGSVALIRREFPEITVLENRRNRGFAGGVNPGIKKALADGAKYVALLNNDAVADKDWLKHLVAFMEAHSKAGIVTSKLLSADRKSLDSTGECYSVWGLPFPRGRAETELNRYDKDTWVFGASGGASLYRTKLFERIGYFDEDFFAYYEDVDISFRAQLAGWKVGFEPKALAYHEGGVTSGQIKDFTTYQTLKNLPLLLWKNVPWALMPKIWPRLVVAYLGFTLQAARRGQFGALLKALAVGTLLWPKKLLQRHAIQRRRQVPVAYIESLIIADLPPGAQRLRALRRKWWRLIGRPGHENSH